MTDLSTRARRSTPADRARRRPSNPRRRRARRPRAPPRRVPRRRRRGRHARQDRHAPATAPSATRRRRTVARRVWSDAVRRKRRPTRSSRSPSPTPSTRSTPRAFSFDAAIITGSPVVRLLVRDGARAGRRGRPRPPRAMGGAISRRRSRGGASSPAAPLSVDGKYNPQTAAYLETVTPKMVAEVGRILALAAGKGNGRRRRRARRDATAPMGARVPGGRNCPGGGERRVLRVGRRDGVRGVRGFRRGRGGGGGVDQRDARGGGGGEGADGRAVARKRWKCLETKKNTCAQPRVERDGTAVSAVSGRVDGRSDRLMIRTKRGKSTSGDGGGSVAAPYPAPRTDPRASFQSDPTWPPSVSSPRARSSAARASTAPRPSVSARCRSPRSRRAQASASRSRATPTRSCPRDRSAQVPGSVPGAMTTRPIERRAKFARQVDLSLRRKFTRAAPSDGRPRPRSTTRGRNPRITRYQRRSRLTAALRAHRRCSTSSRPRART